MTRITEHKYPEKSMYSHQKIILRIRKLSGSFPRNSLLLVNRISAASRNFIDKEIYYLRTLNPKG